MSFIPKLKPNIIIQNEDEDRVPFKTTSALVMHSLFKHYKPQLVNTLDLTPNFEPAPHPALKNENNQNFKTPEKQHDFFNTPNIARGAEGLGDLMSLFVSGNFSDEVSHSKAADSEETNQHQTNPAAFFSISNKLMPSPTNNKKKLDKKYEEALELSRKRQLEKDYENELALRHRPKFRR